LVNNVKFGKKEKWMEACNDVFSPQNKDLVNKFIIDIADEDQFWNTKEIPSPLHLASEIENRWIITEIRMGMMKHLPVIWADCQQNPDLNKLFLKFCSTAFCCLDAENL